jgi:hypothetical protein
MVLENGLVDRKGLSGALVFLRCAWLRHFAVLFGKDRRGRDIGDRRLDLVLMPATTSPSPRIIASNPVLATSTGSSFLVVPTSVSIMSARSKKSVSVAPGIRQVTVTSVFLSFSRSAKENELRNALVPL